MGLGDLVRRWPGRQRSPLALALVLAAAGTVSSAALTQTSHPTGHPAGSASVVSEGTASSPAAGPERLPASVTRIVRQRPSAAPTAVAEPAVHVASTVRTGAVDPRVTGMLLEAYRSAVAGSAPSCHLQVSLLAAIGQVESGSLVGRRLDSKGRTSVLGPVLNGKGGVAAVPDTDHGRWDGNILWDRALGAMQLLPSTVRAFGVDGDGDGVVDPQDVYDATATAAAYLCYGGRNLADPAVLGSAILAYNHSTAYRDLVLTYERRYAGLGLDRMVGDTGFVASLHSLALPATPIQRPASETAAARSGSTVVETADQPGPRHTGTRNTGSTNTGSTNTGGSASGTRHGGTSSASGRPSAGPTSTASSPTSTASSPTPSETGSATPTRVPTDTASGTPTASSTEPPSCPAPATSPSGTPPPTASETPDPTATCLPCEPAPTPTDTATPTATATPTPTTDDPSEVCSAVSSDATASPAPAP